MAFKLIVLATVLAATNAGSIGTLAARSYIRSSLSQGSDFSNAHPSVLYATPATQYSYRDPAVYAAPVHSAIDIEPNVLGQYDFEYSVQNPETSDYKSHREVREGDVVRGSYSLIEADGSNRTVEYTADENNGFTAVVYRESTNNPAVGITQVTPVDRNSASLDARNSTSPAARNPVSHNNIAPVASNSATQEDHYFSAPVGRYHVAPVPHYFAPVDHYFPAPVAHYSPTPAVSYAVPTHILHH